MTLWRETLHRLCEMWPDSPGFACPSSLGKSHPGRTVKVAGKQLGRSAHGGDANFSLADCGVVYAPTGSGVSMTTLPADAPRDDFKPDAAPIGHIGAESGLRCENLPALAETAATATRTGAVGLWAGFIDIQRSTIDGYTVQGRNGLFTLAIVVHLDKSKTAGLSRIAIRADVDSSNGSMSCE